MNKGVFYGMVAVIVVVALAVTNVCLNNSEQNDRQPMELVLANIEALSQNENNGSDDDGFCVWSGKREYTDTWEDEYPITGRLCSLVEYTEKGIRCYGLGDGHICCTPSILEFSAKDKGFCECRKIY